MRIRLASLVALALLAGCTGDNGVTSGTSSRGTSAGTEGSDPGTTQPGGGEGTDPTDGTAPTEVGTFEWAQFGDSERVETSSLRVPLDYSDPSKGTVDLYVARHLAKPDQRIGSLLVNPGGPGFGGSDWGVYADQVYSKALLDRFDIVGWDPRGTGLSTPALDCVDDYDQYYAVGDITPDDAAERQQFVDTSKKFTDGCIERSGDFMQYMGTNNAARDMDAIRRALGEDTISYLGFSYGSELGATWATLFPDTVRAMAIDGAVDPNVDDVEAGMQQSLGFERALDTFLAQCSDDDGCAFHRDGGAEGAFDALMQRLDEQPIPTDPGRPDLTRGTALNGVAEALYSPAKWPLLAESLDEADKGDGSGLLALYDSYFQRQGDGTWPNILEAFQVISCMDDPARRTVAEDDAESAKFRSVAPRMSPATIGSYFCTFFPPTQDPRIEITGKGAGPILVMGTTGDPATPIEGTRKMADSLEDGRLVTVTAEGHGGYGTGDCATDTIDQYLIDPATHAPTDGATCS